MRFRDKLARFFYGRYGFDGLYYALLIAYCVFSIISCFPLKWYLRLIFSALQLAAIVYAFWRALSRDHYARQRENRAFLKLYRPVKDSFILTKNRIRDRKDYRYRRCPHCKAWLRLPKRKGEHPVICPKCKNRFIAKVRF